MTPDRIIAIRAGTTFLLLPREERPRGYDDKLLKALAQHKTSTASVDVDSSSSDAKKLSSVITLCMVTLQKAAAQSCFVYSAKSPCRCQRANSERRCEEATSLDNSLANNAPGSPFRGTKHGENAKRKATTPRNSSVTAAVLNIGQDREHQSKCDNLYRITVRKTDRSNDLMVTQIRLYCGAGDRVSAGSGRYGVRTPK